MPESVDKLLSKCFTSAVWHEAEEAKKFIQGTVYSTRQANFQADLDAMESGWLDIISKGISCLKQVDYERNKYRSR